ncbi:hypothetical protein AB0J09_60055, partial [Nonomuraea sp. NPDC049784]
MDREALYRDPYPLYARARAAPGLTFVEELDAWLVARHADVREVLGRPDDFSSKGALRPDVLPGPAAFAELAAVPGNAPVVLSTDGEAHARYRRPLTRGLSPAKVTAALPFIQATAGELVASFANRPTNSPNVGSPDRSARNTNVLTKNPTRSSTSA